MRKLLAWICIIGLLLIVATLVGRPVRGQAIHAPNSCYPAQVKWKQDSLSVESFGCIDFRGDTLIIIPHLIRGQAYQVVMVLKRNVREITLLVPKQTATFKKEASNEANSLLDGASGQASFSRLPQPIRPP